MDSAFAREPGELAKFEVLEDWLQAPFVTAGLRSKIAKELFMLGWREGA